MGGFAPALIAAMACALCGCTGGSLATDSGPNGPWSTQPRQMVHVGEHVDFSFILTKGVFRKAPRDPAGIADYCVASARAERIEADLDARSGHYRFAFDVVGLRPGETISVSATAYREHGLRDIKQIGDAWVRADDPFDQRDRAIATDTVELTVYRSVVELPARFSLSPSNAPGLVSASNSPDESGEYERAVRDGCLEIRKADGTVSRVQYDPDGRAGFSFRDPDDDGAYLIVYDPRAEELNKFGTTDVRFVCDFRGQKRVFEGRIPTP